MRIRDLDSYVATLMGCVIGMAVGVTLGLFSIALGIADIFPGSGIAGAIALITLASVGGGVVGSWGLLRVCAYPAAGTTARNIAVGWAMASVFLASASFDLPLVVVWLLFAAVPGICFDARRIALATPS